MSGESCLRENCTGSSEGRAEAAVRRHLPRPDTCEAAEQGRGCGGGGGKGVGQGEHGRHSTPRTQRRAGCVTWAGPCARSSTKGQEGTVHGAAAPRRPRPPASRVPGAEPGGGCGGGWGDVGGLRRGTGGQPPEPTHEGAPRQLPGTAVTAGVHPQDGRAAAAARDRIAGGQDRPARGGRGLERHVRDGLPGLLLWVSARAQPTRCVGSLQPPRRSSPTTRGWTITGRLGWQARLRRCGTSSRPLPAGSIVPSSTGSSGQLSSPTSTTPGLWGCWTPPRRSMSLWPCTEVRMRPGRPMARHTPHPWRRRCAARTSL